MTFLAFLPVLLIAVLLVVFKWPIKWAMVLGFVVTGVLVLFGWGMPLVLAAAYSLLGFLKSIDILLVVSGAILLFNVLKTSGGLDTIARSLSSVSSDPRILVMVVGWAFVGFIEGVAGFGTPAVVAAPVLIVAGFQPLAAVSLTLIGNSTSNAFGAAGTPILTQISLLSEQTGVGFGGDLVWTTALIHAVIGIFIPMIILAVMCFVFGKENKQRAFIEAVPFALFAGLVFAATYFLTAWLIGPELPSIMGGLASMIVLAIAAKKRFLTPKSDREFTGFEKYKDKTKSEVAKKMPLWKAYAPYIVISVLLLLTRLPFWDLRSVFNAAALNVTNILGFAGVNWSFEWLWSPGLIFILVAIVMALWHKISKDDTKKALRATGRQVAGVVPTLCFGIAISQLVINSGTNTSGYEGMMVMMAQWLASVFGEFYLVVAPLIGGLGTFISGSNTVSNMLFSSMQFDSALALGISPALISALQCVGGSFGNVVAPYNVAAASAVAGLDGKAEPKVIRANIAPFLIMTVLAAIVAVFLYQVFAV